jgi:hypothetical protein
MPHEKLINYIMARIDRLTRTPLKTGVNPGAQEGLAVTAPLVAPVVLI